MKCEHGNEVSAVLEPADENGWWDDGPKTVNEAGEPDWQGCYLLVTGCDRCKTIHSA